MIPKQEILSIAAATNVLPSTVEKDYILSWTLHGISKNPNLSAWVFKGGTCLKKCFFETYRFSEDLDFTVPTGAVYDAEIIKSSLIEISKFLYEETGIEIREDTIEVKESVNKNQVKTFEAKFGYVGPLNYNVKALPRIKFDITADEILVDAPDIRSVFNIYSDAPEPAADVKCYSIDEILAEKTRAIYERQGRARDLYDIINIGRNFREDINPLKARHALVEKFKFKLLPTPGVSMIIQRIDFEILKANWEQQLRHQLPVLPPVEDFYGDLPAELSWWIEEVVSIPQLPRLAVGEDEKIETKQHFNTGIYQRRLGIGMSIRGTESDQSSGSLLDQIRFAARNRLLISFNYSGRTRVAEPYSLRRPSTGNLLLYVYEVSKGGFQGGGIKAFRISQLANVKVLEQSFEPKYYIEL